MYAGEHNGLRRVSKVFRGQDFYSEVTLKNIYRSKISTGKKYLITKKSYIYSAHLEGDYILYKSPGPTQHENTRLSIIKCNGKENTKLADFFAS